MKTIKTKLNLIMVSLVLLLAAPMANAFYMAEAGRWINRDPFPDSGFALLRQGNGARGPISAGGNLYGFVVNTPTQRVDPLGLFEFDSSCTEDNQTAVKNSFSRACEEAIKSDCFKCLSPEQKQKMMDNCKSGGAGKKVVCKPKGDKDCAGYCGRVPFADKEEKNYGDTIWLCESYFNGACGDGKCTIMHEMVHSAANQRHPQPFDVEKCIGCEVPANYKELP